MSKTHAVITAVGGYVPEYVLNNKELSTMMDTSDEWITSRVGIKERRILKEPNTGTSYMAAKAAEDLFTKTNQVIELSQVSSLVHSITGEVRGDHRIFFPKELINHLHQTPANQLNESQKMILMAYINERHDITYNIQERLF